MLYSKLKMIKIIAKGSGLVVECIPNEEDFEIDNIQRKSNR